MGMMIGTGNSNVKSVIFRNADGTVSGSMSVSGQKKKKTKPLRYNFKEISAQIMRTKTSGNARTVAARARSKAAMLRQKLKNDEYDSKELESALTHALKMERIAKKRMKHLLQEEKIKQKNDSSSVDTDSYADTGKAEEEPEFEKDSSGEKDLKIKEEELKKLMQEYEKFMQEAMKNSGEGLEEDNLLEEMAGAVPEKMSPEDAELLKKKHRAKELKEIMEADLQYLKAMFDRLAREKQGVENGDNYGSNSGDTGSVDSGVSLEIVGMEIPVEMTAAPVVTEGGSVDILA